MTLKSCEYLDQAENNVTVTTSFLIKGLFLLCVCMCVFVRLRHKCEGSYGDRRGLWISQS